jgi:acyl carrier protein
VSIEERDLTEFLRGALALATGRDSADIAPDTLLFDLNMDSVTFVAVVSQVEAIYSVELDPGQVLSLFEAVTVSDLGGQLSLFIGN